MCLSLLPVKAAGGTNRAGGGGGERGGGLVRGGSQPSLGHTTSWRLPLAGRAGAVDWSREAGRPATPRPYAPSHAEPRPAPPPPRAGGRGTAVSRGSPARAGRGKARKLHPTPRPRPSPPPKQFASIPGSPPEGSLPRGSRGLGVGDGEMRNGYECDKYLGWSPVKDAGD